MDFSLSSSLVGSAVLGAIDPSAKSYITAVTSVGATVTPTQRKSLNTFFKEGKVNGWYSKIGRMYLPIWGVAAPNAVDLITTTSGTFSGTVTHSAGFIQGNGSTGRFLMNTSPQGVGMVAGSSSTFALVKTAQNAFNAILASTPVSPAKSNGLAYGTNSVQYFAGRTTGFNIAGMYPGILIESEIAINSRYLRRRTTAGATSLATDTTNITGSYASAFNQSVMVGQSVSNSFYGYSSSELGAYGIGTALTTTQADALTLALKNLWETCTGLILP